MSLYDNMSPEEKAKYAMCQLQAKACNWFDGTEDHTMINKYHHIEYRIIGWEKCSSIKKDLVKFVSVGKLNFKRIFDLIDYSIVKKLKSIKDTQQLESVLIEEVKISKYLIDEYLTGERTTETLVAMYEKNIKLCPVSNALAILEIRYLDF